MALTVPNEGELAMLNLIVADDGNWTLKLYQNDKTPAVDDDATDYTVATFSGYADVSGLTMGAATTVANVASSTGSQETFTHDGGGTSNNIYGYYVLDSNGDVVFAERFDSAPIAMQNNGDTILVTPVLTLKTAGS